MFDWFRINSKKSKLDNLKNKIKKQTCVIGWLRFRRRMVFGIR